ncbi:4Fe-4S dicluster domain-containing protein [Salinarchaeum sp. IM2453]|uniref:4Fe-4S dicluster domain-containing protein n=1 Tax=Salinarchaeum sp. IM2453 TaxID=2862870 RepID=UPI001C832066|nr:4Fe-4S dicluster domain-containing protein [Salinarchaeum sp. IM2453]QZA89591.1 4Fe-4S dicluster domain-containing protein [Salinarchaeum sp. IM2453]
MSETQRVIPNIEACIDCGACEVACQRTWGLPAGSERIRVVRTNEAEDGPPRGGGEAHVPMSCFHCAEAPCISACPTGAMTRSDNGQVRIDKDQCIGCAYCVMSCPFGAPQIADDDAQEETDDRFGSPEAGLADKCTLCEPRLENGDEPACVSECPTDALLFGTPTELSSKLREDTVENALSDDQLSIIFGGDQ